MPKERIYLSQNSSPQPGIASQSIALELGWTDDSGHVTLAVVTIDDETADVLDDKTVYAHGLSYQALNAIVRHTRKARDRAYGVPA